MKVMYGTIHDILAKKNGNIFVKVISNGDIIGRGNLEEPYSDIIDNVETVPISSLKFKLIKADYTSTSSIKATDKYVSLIGDKNTRIMSTEKYGNFIVGSTTFTAHPENIRIGGAFRINGLTTSTMPSTIITPIPMFVFDYPLHDTIKNISSLVNEFEDYIKSKL